MTRIERLERDIESLSVLDLSKFRCWFVEFAATAWDHQFAADLQTGALDRLADAALDEHRTGGSRPG